MTYIIDLQRLWETSAAESASNTFAGLESRKNVVSVIVAVEPNEAMILKTLQSILKQPYVREVIMVNAHESDSLEKMLTTFASTHPKCYVVRVHKSAGLAAAYNLGSQHASGQFLLFMRGNCVLAKNAVAKLLSTGVRKPSPWLVGMEDKAKQSNVLKLSKLFNFFDPLKYEHAQVELPEVSLAGGGFHASHLGPDCFLLSTQLFMEMKGLDKKCFHSTFHTDLCMRIHFAGGGVYRAREFDIVEQEGGVAPIKDQLRHEWQDFCGRFHFYQKYVSKFTNKLLMVFLYSALALGFIGQSFLSLIKALLPKRSKKSQSIKRVNFN